MRRVHKENHLVERIGWLRAAVLGAVEDNGRFEPLDEDNWKTRFMVAPVGFHGLSLEEHIH